MFFQNKTSIVSLIVGSVIVSVFIFGYIRHLQSSTSKPQTIRITDTAGRVVHVPEKVDSVVGTEAGALRIIVYLQAADKVVGVDDFEKTNITRPYILAHPELSALPSIGSMHHADSELVAHLHPDVIFWASTSAGNADVLQAKTGIPVVVLNYGDLDDRREMFYTALRLAAKVLGKQDRAEAVIRFLDNTIHDLKMRTKDIDDKDKPRLYVGGIAYRGLHGMVSTEPDYPAFEFINVLNVASSIKAEHAFVDMEQIIEWDPDKIFIDETGYSFVKEEIKSGSIFHQTLSAVKTGELYAVMPYNWYAKNFGTMLANAYYIGTIAAPDRFNDIDPAMKADEIYKMLVGKDVYFQMKALYGGFQKITPGA